MIIEMEKKKKEWWFNSMRVDTVDDFLGKYRTKDEAEEM